MKLLALIVGGMRSEETMVPLLKLQAQEQLFSAETFYCTLKKTNHICVQLQHVLLHLNTSSVVNYKHTHHIGRKSSLAF